MFRHTVSSTCQAFPLESGVACWLTIWNTCSNNTLQWEDFVPTLCLIFLSSCVFSLWRWLSCPVCPLPYILGSCICAGFLCFHSVGMLWYWAWESEHVVYILFSPVNPGLYVQANHNMGCSAQNSHLLQCWKWNPNTTNLTAKNTLRGCT